MQPSQTSVSSESLTGELGTKSGSDEPLCCAPVTSKVLSEDAAARLSGVIKTLGDVARLRLVSILANADAGEVCACDLPKALGRSQSTISHHLSQLQKAGLIEREQRGKWAWFRLRKERLAEVTTALGAVFPQGPQPGP